MDNKERDKSGAFYCFDRGTLTRTAHRPHRDHQRARDLPGWPPSLRRRYLKGTIDFTDIEADGTLGERRPFIRIAPTDGHPDGPTIDSEGCVWISLYAGWEAWRYSPSGKLLDRVRFPVANITKIAFGGDDLRTAYATTARQS